MKSEKSSSQTITSAKAGSLRKFSYKYGDGDVRKYYPKHDVAV